MTITLVLIVLGGISTVWNAEYAVSDPSYPHAVLAVVSAMMTGYFVASLF